ncbi:MAG: hypothetical protein AAFZ80_11140 [Cyanobacteria bacterium P01_A01_bin.105]
MLYFVVAGIFILIAALVIGIGLLHWLDGHAQLRAGDRAILALWVGLIVMANGLLALALLLPLSPIVGGAAMVLAVAVALAFPAVRHDLSKVLSPFARLGLWWLLILAVLVAAFTSRQVVWFDTGLYHFGSIQWLESHGAVPGIGLINSGFAFVSAWFALAAPFNPRALGSSGSAILSSVSLLLVLLHGALCVIRVWRRSAQLSDWFWLAYLLLTLPVLTLTSFMSAVLVSPSPDIPVIFLVGITAWAILVSYQPLTGDPSSIVPSSNLTPLLMFGVGAVTFKLHGLPVLLIALALYGFRHFRSLRQLTVGVVLVAVTVAPMLAHGVIASGCPLYPSTVLCADVPWRVLESEASAARASISGWSSWFNLTPSNLSSRWQIFQAWLALAHLNKVMLGLAVMAIPLLAWLSQHLRRHKYRGGGWIIALSLLGMAFIFARAPLMRFGMGYFMALPALAMASAVAAWLPRKTIDPSDATTLQLSLPQGGKLFMFFLAGLIVVRTVQSPEGNHWLIPPELPEARVTAAENNDIDYLHPTYADQCWGAEIPCAPGPLSASKVELLDPEQGIAGGFMRP